jgi:hypothetical protein
LRWLFFLRFSHTERLDIALQNADHVVFSAGGRTPPVAIAHPSKTAIAMRWYSADDRDGPPRT